MAFLLSWLVASSCFALEISASTITYNWDLDFIQANPDGRATRPVLGINGKFPNPTIAGNIGDKLVVNLNNKTPNETTSIHFHGLYQVNNNDQDGPPGTSQCEILPGQNYTYQFTLGQSGTYWWHSHSSGQYADGLRGPIVVHDPRPPFKYDEELVISVSDWYHDQLPNLLPQYMSNSANPDGGEPVPYSALMNEGNPGPQFQVQAGKTYLLRIINMAAFSQVYFHIDQHNMTIVEADGTYTQPKTVTDLYLATAQRYSVLVTAMTGATQNFAILASMDTNAYDNIPSYLNPNVTGALVYDATKPIPSEAPAVPSFNPVDDYTLVPYDQEAIIRGIPTRSITLDLDFATINGLNRAVFNNITYVRQTVPSLYTALSAGASAADPRIYGATNAHVVFGGDIVEIVINNFDSGQHPVHLHGHTMQLVARAPGVFTPRPRRQHHPNIGQHAGPSPATVSNSSLGFTPGQDVMSTMPQIPMRRDTWTVAPNGYTVWRYRAQNPGVWLLHCHMEWHVSAGLTATIVEDPFTLQKTQATIPPAMVQICKSQNIPTSGNCAGNTQNLLDTSKCATQPTLDHGALYPVPPS